MFNKKMNDVHKYITETELFSPLVIDAPGVAA
ncbi:hypothetical protein X741_17580 [Mesorhizobium sp. LNHC229A00]|nr:hypothetical protein X741_17580 [Mesorhizobium sp. LNHC229A00]